MTKTITITEFKDLLETYGTDLNRWPAESQDAASALLEQSDAAQNLFADMAQIDQALTGNDSPLPQDLLDRILQKAQKS